MSSQRRLAWATVAVACVALTCLLAWRSVPHAPPRLTLLYTRGLSGCVDEADRTQAGGPAGASAASVAAAVQRWRAAARESESVVVVDLGGSLTGVGLLNAFGDGRPMAQALSAASCDAVLPSPRDLWTGRESLEEMARVGRFSFLLGSARLDGSLPTAWGRPRIHSVEGLKLAVFGAYAQPIGTDGSEATAVPALGGDAEPWTFSRNLDVLRASIREVGADVNVVVANVSDPLSLARQLPEAQVVVPAGPSSVPPAIGETELGPGSGTPPALDVDAAKARLAPALLSPALLGAITLSRDAEGRVQTAFEVSALTPADAPPAWTELLASYRASLDRASGGRQPQAASLLRAYVDGDAAACDLLADVAQQALDCDVVLLSPKDTRGRLAGAVTETRLSDAIDREASVAVVGMDGKSLAALLERTPTAAFSGLAVWRAKGRLRACFAGRPLEEAAALRVAVSTRLVTGETGVSLLAVAVDALSTRPLLDPPSRRSFTLGDAPPDVTALLKRADLEATTGHGGRARDLLVEAAALAPADPVAILDALQSQRPWQPASYADLAAIEAAAGNPERAVEALEMGRVAWPSSWHYPLEQARLLLKAGDIGTAGALMQEARRLGAPAPLVSVLQGQLLLDRGRTREAAALLEDALEGSASRDPWTAQARALQGIALLRQGAVDRALATWAEIPQEGARVTEAP